MPPATPPLPNFLIIGAQRCAARWLRYNLDQHPDVYAPPSFDAPDGPGFFHDPDCLDRFGVKQYRTRFGAWDGEPVVGECCPSYLVWPGWGNDAFGLPSRIGMAMPDVRLIAVVRDPIERMLSSVQHHIRRGRLPADVDLFTELVEVGPDVKELDLLNGSIYCATLKVFEQRLPGQLLVLFYDDIRDRPQVAYEAALRHIGASTDFVPDDLDRVLFANGPMPEGRPAPDLTLEQRQTIYFWFRQDVLDLAEMTGRDLSAWDPGVAEGG